MVHLINSLYVTKMSLTFTNNQEFIVKLTEIIHKYLENE
jgi:hypothetical protein